MRRGSGNEWDQEHSIPVHYRTRNGWSRSDNDNSVPIHFLPTSSLPSSGYGNSMSNPFSGTADWQPTHHFRTPSFPQASDPRFVPTTGGRPFEESAFVRRRASSRFPSDPSGSRIAPLPSNLPPRFPQLQENMHIFRGRDDITKQEQEKAMKMLKKQIYCSDPKSQSRRLSLYYQNIVGSGKESEDDSKRCVVCLEEFLDGNEVMVTPCNHTFHEDCIVPWIKSHGQCPVCRFVVSERIKANAMELSNASVPPRVLFEEDGRFISDHVVSVIRAMDDAFSWGRPRYNINH